MMIPNLQIFFLFLRLSINQFIRGWSKPATGLLALGTMTDLTRSRTDILVENALLRQQLIILNRQTNRPQLTNNDRVCLVILARFTNFWQQALHIVRPDTLLKTQKTVSAGVLIAQLNPIIRGWAQYHQHVVSKQAFVQVDNAVFLALWRWAIRRHPQKGKRWIKRKYFKRVGSRNWVFFGDHNGKEWRWFFASRLPIKRHIKIKADANPYDPAWELYFEARLARQMAHTLRGSRQIDYLWRAQNGVCPVCQQKLTEATRWHNHHLVWRSLGGPDTADNRVLLHPNCHRQVHSQPFSVEKPRPSPGV
jgi:hypothetical protein